MRCADCPDVPNGTRKRPICCRREGAQVTGAAKQWRCINCKRVIKAVHEPERCLCLGREFAEVAQMRIGDTVPHVPPPPDVRPAFTGAGGPSFKPARHGKRAPGR
jgi:hypothetical protein